LDYFRDLVQKKEYIGLFVDLAQDFEKEADDMIKYLNDIQTFQKTDFIEPENNTGIKSDFTVHTFPNQFLNLLDSTAYICSVIRINPIFGNE